MNRDIFRTQELERQVGRPDGETVRLAGPWLRIAFWGALVSTAAAGVLAFVLRVEARSEGPAAVVDRGLVTAVVPTGGGTIELGALVRVAGMDAGPLQVVSVDADPIAVVGTQRLLGLDPTAANPGALVVVRALSRAGAGPPVGWRGRLVVVTRRDRLLGVLVSGMVQLGGEG